MASSVFHTISKVLTKGFLPRNARECGNQEVKGQPPVSRIQATVYQLRIERMHGPKKDSPIPRFLLLNSQAIEEFYTEFNVLLIVNIIIHAAIDVREFFHKDRDDEIKIIVWSNRTPFSKAQREQMSSERISLVQDRAQSPEVSGRFAIVEAEGQGCEDMLPGRAL